MNIRMKVVMSGTRNGQAWPPPGETLDVPKAEAQGYFAAGIAEPADSDKAEAAASDSSDVEAATVDTAPKRRGRPPKNTQSE